MHASSRSLPPFLCAVAVLAAMCAPLSAAERNIVFFITDDQGQTLGCYGDAAAATPHVDRLAADGVLFLNAFATTASCSPSRSVVMSGLHNHANGQYGLQHDEHHFSSYHNVVSLALPRVLADAGYRTAHSGKYHVAPEAVYHFETYLRGNGRSTVELVERCRDFITDATDPRPFFLYVGTTDPHRGGGRDQSSPREIKPDLFGNKPDHGAYPEVQEVFYEPDQVPVPAWLPDTPETREELAQYYQSCARIDQGFGRLVEILRQAGVYEQTMIVFTSDHGMAFPGAKTTVYDPGLRVPFVVRNPYREPRGLRSQALISHVDITPSLLDFAGGLDHGQNAPLRWRDPDVFWRQRGEAQQENRAGGHAFRRYQGKSWLPVLAEPEALHRDAIFASHTFHEIQMYYPMRAVQDRQYKLIWNIASPLPFPFASDLWAASTWQAQYRQGPDTPYGHRTVREYLHRPAFELYDLAADPLEARNLAGSEPHQDVLRTHQQRLRAFQQETGDPWLQKWDYE